MASCGAIAGHFEERIPDNANINGFNINIRSSGGAGSGAGSRAVTLETATNWDSEADFNQAVSRFRVQIGDEPERTIKFGDTITSQKRYSPGANVTVSYTAEADVTYTVQGEMTAQGYQATQTRTMLIARETKEIKVGAAASTQVAFRIRDTITPSPTPNYTGNKVRMRDLNDNDTDEYVYVNEGDPLSEFLVGNFNNIFNNMYGFTGKLETSAEWAGKEYYVTAQDITNGYINGSTLFANGSLVIGVPLDIDNTHYLQDLTDWELFKLYGTNFERATNRINGDAKYYKLVPFTQGKPKYQYHTLKTSKSNIDFDVKSEFGIKDTIVTTAGMTLYLDAATLKLNDNTDPYDKTAKDPDGKDLFDAKNSVVGPYYSYANTFIGVDISGTSQSILLLMQNGGKRQMLVYRPETVRVTLDYGNIKNQNYWKDDGKLTRVISVPKDETITANQIEAFIKAEAKTEYEISYTGSDIAINGDATQTITINAGNVSATRMCNVTLKYKDNQKNIRLPENTVMNENILDFLNTEFSDAADAYRMDKYATDLKFEYKWHDENVVISAADKEILIQSGMDVRDDSTWKNNCIDQYLSATINLPIDKNYYFVIDASDGNMRASKLLKKQYPRGTAPTKTSVHLNSKTTGGLGNIPLYSDCSIIGGQSKIGEANFGYVLLEDFFAVYPNEDDWLYSNMSPENPSLENPSYYRGVYNLGDNWEKAYLVYIITPPASDD